jgi:aromatic ring-opening dioxygenase LigB subunit
MGFKKEGKKFDESVQNAIKQISISKLLLINEEITNNASECAYRPLLILFGITERMNIKPEILAYESPFGVGYLTVNFHIQ